MGKSKTISSDVIDRMIKNYQEVSPEEGFDEVVNQDNTEELRKVISDEPVSESKTRYIKTFKSFK